MNWLRYLVLALTLLSVAWGYRRGFVRTVISMAFLFLVLAVSAWLNPGVTEALREHTGLAGAVEERVFDLLEEGGGLSFEDPAMWEGALEEYGIPSVLVEGLLDSAGGAAEELTRQVHAAIAAYAANAAVRAIAYLLSFFLADLLVKAAVHVVELAVKLPGLSLLNRLAGAGLGVVRALIWLWIFFLLPACFAGSDWGRSCLLQIRQDPILLGLYQADPLLILLRGLIG